MLIMPPTSWTAARIALVPIPRHVDLHVRIVNTVDTGALLVPERVERRALGGVVFVQGVTERPRARRKADT